MFDHEKFDKYSFEDIPLNQDLYIVDEIYLDDYESSMVSFFEGAEYKIVGFVSYAAARSINNHSLELSWYPNIYDRFHEISITLPIDQVIVCVGCWQYDEKPHIFVKSDWLKGIYLRKYSTFALIDAIDVKIALENGDVSREKLVELRGKIDLMAECHPSISFISFGDSLLLKSNWSVGHFKSEIKYSYEPELFVHLAEKINRIYQDILGLSTYTIIVQGCNEYYDDPQLHISKTANHVSLNSLGLPFSQLMEIEREARRALKLEKHPPAELYMDQLYFHSLKYKSGFEKNAEPHNSYRTKMRNSSSKYYYSSRRNILENIASEA